MCVVALSCFHMESVESVSATTLAECVFGVAPGVPKETPSCVENTKRKVSIKPRISKAKRAGLILPPSRVRAKVRANAQEFRFEKDLEIWLAAAVEVVLRDALQKCGVRATLNRTSRGRVYRRNKITEENLDWLGQQPDFVELVATLKGGNSDSVDPETTSSPEKTIETSSSSNSRNASTGMSESSSSQHCAKTLQAKWQYEDNGWRDYDREASEEVERCYQTYLNCPGQFDVRSIQSGTWHYQVDFPQMIQTNIRHENHTRRAIRRVRV